ncbi:MAG TPA: acetylglutamate kinase [Bacteroidia bacterium]|jgi:acetylglutamate kinase
MKNLYIVKIGGNVINDPEAMEKFLNDFSSIKQHKLLVHGGGKQATELAAKLGVSQAMVKGRRITDAETLKIITMVFGGSLNKNIVASLQSKGINAIGLSGADGNSILAKKRQTEDIDFGYAGEIIPSGINVSFITALLESSMVPVFSAITHDGKGQLLNTNADSIASALAIELSAYYNVHLHYCFEKKGVLKDAANDGSVISTLNHYAYSQLLSAGCISEGMIPKLDNAFAAKQKGVNKVMIAHPNDLIEHINDNTSSGTTIFA